MASQIGIISDFDDTLKVTNTTNRLKTLLRGLFKKQVYAGMSELYQEFLGNENPFYVVSSSPRIIRRKISRFLKMNRFPKCTLILRDWVKQKNVKSYKFNAIESILIANPQSQWLLFGDDSEWDPEILCDVATRHPDKILGVYIRSIRNRPIPKQAFAFSTAFDVALKELNLGRLSLPQVARIGKAIMDTDDFENIIPYFAHHPEVMSGQPNASLSGIYEAIETRLHRRR